MAKVVTVTQYQANDGSLFLTEAECNAHDFKLENGERIDAAADSFLNATHAIDRSRNMQRNVIVNFLAFYLPWVEAGSVFVERTVFDTPKPEADVAKEGEAADAVSEALPVEEETAPVF